MLTRARVDEAERLAAAATGGPWSVGEPMQEFHEFNTPILLPEQDNKAVAWARFDAVKVAGNAAHIAHSRTFVPEAVETIRALVEALLPLCGSMTGINTDYLATPAGKAWVREHGLAADKARAILRRYEGE